ncbi:hypothetical protein ACU686_23885 [Yinghuangia aomiensis]
MGPSIDFDITFTSGPATCAGVFRLLDRFKPDVITSTASSST